MASDRIFSVPIYWSALSIDSKFRHVGQAPKPDFVLHFFYLDFCLKRGCLGERTLRGKKSLGKSRYTFNLLDFVRCEDTGRA